MIQATLTRLKEQLKLHEGVREYPYTDTTGHTTIGCGRNLDDVGLREDEIDLMLENDIGAALQDCKNWDYFGGLNGPRQAALVDLRFNLGPGGYRTFKRMHEALKNRDFVQAAAEMLDSLWASQVGDRSSRLARQMKTGLWVE